MIRSRPTTTKTASIVASTANHLTERRMSPLAMCQFVNRTSVNRTSNGSGMVLESSLTSPALGAIVVLVTDPTEHPRAFPRFELKAYVDYTGSEVLLYHKIQNISLGGICIQSSAVEELGTVVDLVLNFPDLDSTIAVKGEVVWANGEPPMDMGIRYTDLDDDRKDTLRRYLSLLAAKSPAR